MTKPDIAIVHFEQTTGRKVRAASIGGGAKHCSSVLDDRRQHWTYDRSTGAYVNHGR